MKPAKASCHASDRHVTFPQASRARLPGGAVGGRQYIAVSTRHSPVSSGLNTLAEELHPGNASNIFVFALPETI